MFLIFGNGKWSQNHIRILRSKNIEFEVIDLPEGSDFKTLLNRSLEGVFIITSSPNHFPILLHCLVLGIPVFCEKPICLRRSQLLELKNTFEIHKPIFMSGHQLVFTPQINTGNTITYFNSMRAGAIPRTEGAILSLAVHDIAVAYSLFGNRNFNVFSVEGNKHECKILLCTIPNNYKCEIYVSSFSNIRLRNITFIRDNMTTCLQPDNWAHINILEKELLHFLFCCSSKSIPEYNNFHITNKVMNTVFDIMDKINN